MFNLQTLSTIAIGATGSYIFTIGLKNAFAVLEAKKRLGDLPEDLRDLYRQVLEYAAAADVPKDLAVALIQTENSDWNTETVRFEPNIWRRLEARPELYPNLPWRNNPNRMASAYGLTQITYPTALQIGYPESELPEILLYPQVNLPFGLKYFKMAIDAADGRPAIAYLKYNAGLNAEWSTAIDQARANVRRFIDNLNDARRQYAL